MLKSKKVKIIILVFIVSLALIIPPPDGLTKEAWILAGIYLAAIVGLVSKPYPEPVIILSAMALSCFTVGRFADSPVKSTDVLSGYASGTTWLVFSAFTLSAAFVTTGLGKRLAYWFILKFGGTTLRLGYVTALLDLILSPATPSNTARAGGIVFPIINSIALALGSTPNESPCKAGRFLMVNVYMVTKTTSYMFLTAFAGNALALQLISDIFQIHLSWAGWAIAAVPLGLLMLAIIPWVAYKIARPQLTSIDNVQIATAGLNALGPISGKEKGLIVVFISALLGWIFCRYLGLHESSVAVIAMAGALIFSIICWNDVLQNKGGWNTLIWYGGIIGLSATLSKEGFFKWLAAFMSERLDFLGAGNSTIVIIVFISIIVRYMFASGGAYVAAMVPVFATVGLVTGTAPVLLALAILFSNSYGGCITHYGGAAGPIIFAAGYNDIKSWWIIGTITALLTFILHMLIGIPWWNFLINNKLI
ncbi:anion permease [Mixta tenebrionis]|uniref:Anion permease n=1 Tax=Mixta tenebrionis TaxID=2562439 RepID=A0A506VFB4_9GAMM|nr:anion permease [Mixta tenebrionis]TPW43683.1 anion permease [Mixta tenebrionis]